ncbi:hypothetical protein [Microbulbifer sp. PSTR4-B]|uniref:hypothetical protein n=1 Tax=Microbulbifer sp. PSTR4-B TaxID=3243396 RepID=UPI00403A0F61
MDIIEKLKNFSSREDIKNEGLQLTDGLVEGWYECSPVNCVAFATTGGDGVHFSVFKELALEESPIVMTVPMNFGEENLVIARSMQDFLRLGSRYGFFELEQLSYNFESTAQGIQEASSREAESKALLALSKEFELAPIEGVVYYIREVNEEFYSRLELKNA